METSRNPTTCKIRALSPSRPGAGCSCRGVTLVELMVVVAILAVLLGLLLPAIQGGRESARRLQCQNNLKQIALASHLFHNARRVLPPSRIAKQHPAWLYLILPYLEQQAIIWPEATRRSMYEMPVELRTAVVPQYLCPARDRENAVVAVRADAVHFFPDRKSFEGSVSDYGGIKGARTPGQNYTGVNVLLENGAIVHGVYDQFPNNAQIVTGYRGLVSLAMIEDGTSHTLLIGEITRAEAQSSHAFNGDKTGGHWLGIQDPPAVDGQGTGIGSDHPGLSHFAFCDGSVRPLATNVDVLTLEGLATRAGSEGVDAP